MRFTLSTILFALGCLFAGISARTQFAFSEIDSRNTLSDNRIRNIAQLTDGRMLVITEGIANLFDGTTFKHIHKRAGDSMPLTGYYGFHHSYVEGGRVWIKNYQELMLIDIGKEAYENHPDSVLKDMGINEGAADLFVDVFKNYWVKTISDNLLFHSTTRNCTRLFTKRVSYPQNTKDELFDIATVKNEVFLFYKSGLMLCYDIASAKLLYKIDIFNAKDRETYNRTLIVVQDRNYLYTLRNNKKGIMQAYNTHNRTWSTVLNTDYWLNTISIDNNGNILVSCKKGLWEIDKSLAEKELTGTFRLVDGTDVTTEASTLFNDNQGGFWIGTFNHGLLYYHADRFKFTNIGKLYFNSSGEDIVINCFSELLPGKILIGTNKGVFSCSSLGEEIRPIPMALNAGACYTMTTFGDRVVLQTDKGNYVYDGEHIVPANSFFSDTRILCPTSAGRFLVFDNSQKWGIANPANYQVYPLHFNQNPVNPGSFRKVIQFNENEFLGLTPHEVFCINTGNKPSKSSAILPHDKYHPLYTDMLKDSRGLIWIGTQDGLILLNPKDNSRQTLYTEDGLVNNSIKAIGEDYRKNIWVSTSGGVSRISLTPRNTGFGFRIACFNRFDGVIENEFCERSILLTKNDLLLIGGINGLNATNLKKPWIFQHLQKPLFTSLSLFGTTVKPGEHYNGNEILGHSISSTDKIELRYNQNFISIGFSALNYVNPSQTYYRYRLEGLDNDWREISAANGDGSATYTNLAPGTYELQVEAANNSKEWSANVAHLTIIVHPPFWKTPLAYLLYLVLVCSAILLIYKNMQQRARNLTARRNAEKLNHMKFAFFTNISHEFRTPLTLILTPLESLLKEIKGTEIGNRLRPVYRNAQELLNLVNQLLDFRRLEIHGEKLNLSFGNISAFASQFEEIFSRLAFERKISFHVNCSPDELLVFFDNSKLYKVINNLLSNAFKFTPDGGEITLDLKRVEDNIVIRVIDNGQGIPENEIAHVFDRFYQASGVEGGSGIGLHLVKEYVELHNGTIEAESLPGIKTVFTVRLPMDLSPETSNGVEAYEPVIEPGEHAFPNNCSYKLLVVEDNEELRHFLVSELYKSYQLIEAKDGVEGLEKAIAEQPDLIISDVMMPRMDGVELCRKIKSELATSHIPVILLTARASEEQRMTGYEAGADEYLAKPFNMDILLMRIAKLIDNQRIRQKRFTEKVEINPSEITITSLDEQLVQKALALIECNMGNGDYSVQQLSQDLAMDRTVLYKKLQSITGLAPLEFIRSIRIKRAAALLTQGKYPVAEVAEMVGFNTQKYFSRYFKEAFGATPSQYVQQFNENAVNNKPYQK